MGFVSLCTISDWCQAVTYLLLASKCIFLYLYISFLPRVFMYNSDKKTVFLSFYLGCLYLDVGWPRRVRKLLQIEQKCSSAYIMHVQHVFVLILMPGYSSFSTQWSLALKCIDLINIAYQKLIDLDLTIRLVYRLTCTSQPGPHSWLGLS